MPSMSFNDWMQRIPGNVRLLVAIAAFFVLMFASYSFFLPMEQRRTEEAVAFIKAQKITLDDVMGKNLPPAPDPKLVNATIGLSVGGFVVAVLETLGLRNVSAEALRVNGSAWSITRFFNYATLSVARVAN
jgi:hypothetical protein